MKVVSVSNARPFQGSLTIKPGNYESIIEAKEPKVAENIKSLQGFVERHLPDDMDFFASLYNIKTGASPTRTTPHQDMGFNIRKEGHSNPFCFLSGEKLLNQREFVELKKQLVEFSNVHSSELIKTPSTMELLS